MNYEKNDIRPEIVKLDQECPECGEDMVETMGDHSGCSVYECVNCGMGAWI